MVIECKSVTCAKRKPVVCPRVAAALSERPQQRFEPAISDTTLGPRRSVNNVLYSLLLQRLR